jgi:hypothetical protein
MHIGQPGSPVSVSGINIRYLSVIFVIWNIYSFNAITTGVNARALRVPHTGLTGSLLPHHHHSSFAHCVCRTQVFEVTTRVLERGEVRLSQTELLLR